MTKNATTPHDGATTHACATAIAAERWVASPRTKPRLRTERLWAAVNAADNVERLPHRPPEGAEHERTASGRLIPPTKGWCRSLDRTRSTRAWRAAADQLDAAREAVHVARLEPGRRHLHEALDAYEQAALAALYTPTRRMSDLRHRLSLVAFLAGVEDPIGVAFREGWSEWSPLRRAFALLDHELFCTTSSACPDAETRLAGSEARRLVANDNATLRCGEG